MISEFYNWQQTKPRFYADSRLIGTSALKELETIELDLDPALLDKSPRGPFVVLEQTLKQAVYNAFVAVSPEVPECPYHKVLASKLGKRALPQELVIETDKRDLIEATLPGGTEAPVLITGLISRMDAIRRVFDLDTTPEELAYASSGLINAPLRHPQQWAKAFIFTLVDPDAVKQLGGSAFTFDRNGFLPDDLIRKYLRVAEAQATLAVEWSMPIGEFTLSAPVQVFSRTLGSERVVDDSTILYPGGVKLGDITIDEQTLSCPGKPMAHYLWNEATRLSAKYDLWARNQRFTNEKSITD